MERNSTLRLLSKSDVLSRLAYSKSTLHARINSGMMTPPVSQGSRKVAWPEHEIDKIIATTINATSPDDIKACVNKLMDDRKLLLSTFM